MSAFSDVIGEKLYGKECFGPPHRLSGPDHALRCVFYRRRMTSVFVAVIIGAVAAVFLGPKFGGYGGSSGGGSANKEEGGLTESGDSSDGDKGMAVGVGIGIFIVVASVAAFTTFKIYGFVVTHNYEYYTNLFEEKKEMYISAGDSEQRAEVLADNDVSNEFDRRKIASRYARY